MPIKIPMNLPAGDTLEKENIFIMNEKRAITQDIRPLKVVILNLMPTKIVTETQILRKLSNTPLQIEIELLQTATYKPHNTDPDYLDEFYVTFDQIKDNYYDGLIITGAPLDFVPYEEVEYWDEICQIIKWSKKHVHCTFYLCWGAFAGLYYNYGIDKHEIGYKISGIFEHKVLNNQSPLFRGFDDVFYAPQSRAVEVRKEDILKVPELELMSESDEAGVTIVKSANSREFYVFCHTEYDRDTLKLEYERDLEKGINPDIPKNYFPDDDPTKDPIVRWRSTGQLLWTNWINYYVYQTTPYDIKDVQNEGDDD